MPCPPSLEERAQTQLDYAMPISFALLEKRNHATWPDGSATQFVGGE